MDPNVIVPAGFAALAIILAAYLGRPTIGTRRDVRHIKEQFENNGGSSARDSLDRIEQSVTDLTTDVANLRGRFNQHINDTTLARRERIGMWSAVEAVSKSEPPTRETDK